MIKKPGIWSRFKTRIANFAKPSSKKETVEVIEEKDNNIKKLDYSIDFIDNKEIVFSFERVTLRFKYLFNQFSDNCANLFAATKLTDLQVKIYDLFVKNVTMFVKNSDGTYEHKPIFKNEKNCCIAVDKEQGAAKWHSYYFLDNLAMGFLHLFTGSKIAVIAYSAIMQGYDKCPNQENLFAKESRLLSYAIGGLNGLFCILAQCSLAAVLGVFIPNIVITTVVSAIIIAPISSAVMCKIEAIAKDLHNSAVSLSDLSDMIKTTKILSESYRSTIDTSSHTEPSLFT